MRLQRLEITGFKSFGKKTTLVFETPLTAIVGPNGSGKSNIAEAFRWALGEQSLKSLRGKRGEDLIWNGGESGGRGGRASVTLVFTNTDRIFDLDFDEVAITRTVHRDGVNDYELNGSKVRLRDVLELLAKVSLGASGHTIVSQGDADRILLATIYERKIMIEESLGLKVYQWKLAESDKKLAQADDNIHQVESLRREISPHLKFLKKQVEKIAQTDQLRQELKGLYREYLAREALYLEQTKKDLVRRQEEPQRELSILEAKIKMAEKLATDSAAIREENELITEQESELIHLRRTKDDFSRTLGRLEGMIEVKSEKSETGDETISLAVVKDTLTDIDSDLSRAETEGDWNLARSIIRAARAAITDFLTRHKSVRQSQTEELKKLETEAVKIKTTLADLETKEEKLVIKLAAIKQALEKKKETSQGALRDLYELRTRRTELLAALETLQTTIEKLALEEADLKRELDEGAILVDQEIRTFAVAQLGATFPTEERRAQEKRRRDIERLKIKIEDVGIESTDVLNEYKQMSERDEYLAKELADLENSQTTLKAVMADLKGKLETEFSNGFAKINKEFGRYFELMFGGGTARLELLIPEKKRKKTDSLDSLEISEADIEIEEETKPGIDILVNLPRKKIRGLQMLSGGERALTSIALLFAIAAVNPPPFLILDETDAALDEANSKKYGDMIETLAQSSQLILITHNRETMSRAGVLYGVTMSGDGVSRLLSVRFEEATAFAK